MQITYTITYTPEDSYSYAFRAPVPIRYGCLDLPPGYLTTETAAWNCNLCGSDKPFFAPYEPGDIIPFQTRFADNYNLPADVISTGFKTSLSGANNYVIVELYDCCGNLISNNLNTFSETYWIGYSVATGTVQTWFVNTGLFPTDLKCFRLKITYYKYNQITTLYEIERSIYTEFYKEVAECGSDTESVLIESYYSNYDCNGNFYGTLDNYNGTINTPFYNSMRVFGEVEFTGDSESVTENDRGTLVSKDITEGYRIISSVSPPYFVRRLQQTLRGRTINVDGVQYQNFSYTQLGTDSRMFLIDIEFDKKCFIDNRTCNF